MTSMSRTSSEPGLVGGGELKNSAGGVILRSGSRPSSTARTCHLYTLQLSDDHFNAEELRDMRETLLDEWKLGDIAELQFLPVMGVGFVRLDVMLKTSADEFGDPMTSSEEKFGDATSEDTSPAAFADALSATMKALVSTQLVPVQVHADVEEVMDYRTYC